MPPAKQHSEENEGTKISEKINTVTVNESPQELFESKLIDLLEKVLRRQVGPQESIHQLHDFWQSLSIEFRNELSSANPGNVIDAGVRLRTAAEMLANETSALIAEHNNSKGF